MITYCIAKPSSGTANYAENLDCKWVIKGIPGQAVVLTFTVLKTEELYDSIDGILKEQL